MWLSNSTQRASVLVDVFEFFQMVVPRKFQEERSDDDEEQSQRGVPEPPGHDVDGQSHQRDLPDHSHHNVKNVASKVPVGAEGRILLLQLFQNWTPEAPWAHTPVEIFQDFFILGCGQQCADEASDERYNEYHAKAD